MGLYLLIQKFEKEYFFAIALIVLRMFPLSNTLLWRENSLDYYMIIWTHHSKLQWSNNEYILLSVLAIWFLVFAVIVLFLEL